MRSEIQSIKSIRTLACAASILGALFLPVYAQAPQSTPPPSQHSMGSRRNSVGLPNFGEVTPNLYRGGQPGVDGLETLQKMGIGIVVDMRSGPNQSEKTAVTKLGMEYVSIPWHCPFPTDDPFVRFLKVIDENRGKKIFVHCRLGDDRTGMAIASYRMAYEGWSAGEAMKEMELFGFGGVHRAICPGLAPYEKRFPRHLETNPAFKGVARAVSPAAK